MKLGNVMADTRSWRIFFCIRPSKIVSSRIYLRGVVNIQFNKYVPSEMFEQEHCSFEVNRR